jgi:hypothetical protein
MATYAGLLAAYEITITGTLPKGDTTRTDTYFITDSNTIVGQVVLPDAVKKYNSVLVTLKVPNASRSYAIGTIDDDGFHASTFLSVRNPTGNQRPSGALRTITGILPKGETTRTVPYFITVSNTIVGQVVLPDAIQQNNSVSVPLKVPNARESYAIGTFDNDGFHASSFLSVRTPTSKHPSGVVGQIP